MEFSAQQIAGFLNGTIEGDPNVKVSNFSKIEEGKPGTLTFLANLKYAHHIYNTEASIVLVNNDIHIFQCDYICLLFLPNILQSHYQYTLQTLFLSSEDKYIWMIYLYIFRAKI